MLSNLIIKNFAVIDQVELELTTGFNILTGETGAGKSVIIKALRMLLGERASTDFIRQGKNKALIEGCFDISNQQVVQDKLVDLGIEVPTDQNLILTREISHTANNKSRVNGRIVTLDVTREISDYLIDIHTQHEYQRLLSTTDQLDILDQLGTSRLLELKEKISAIYHQLKVKEEQLAELNQNQKERERRIDLLKFQLSEIEEADLKPGEEADLLAERKKLSNAEELNQTLVNIYNQLSASDYQTSAIVDQLQQLSKELESLVDIDSELEELATSFRDVIYKLEDLSFQINDYQASLEFNQQRLTVVQDRLKLINDLKRKYGDSISDILDYYAEIKEELDKLQNSKQRKKKIKLEKEELEEEYFSLATDLSQLRKEVATKLEDEILTELSDLAIKEANFKVAFSKREEFSAFGLDKIKFLLAPNPGSELKSLADIASGGELSRVMLVLKSILAQQEGIFTLVFDEIDAGIGGRVAKLVAAKLTSLAEDYQLLCITHLPQIACQADKHYLITKQVTEGVTSTEIAPLGQKEQIKELARMLDGSLDQTALEHAKELLVAES